jgi:hypothetical protein
MMPLLALKQRLNYLKDELSPALAPEHNTAFEILAEETDRLIERSSEFGLVAEMRRAPAVIQEPANEAETTEL